MEEGVSLICSLYLLFASLCEISLLAISHLKDVVGEVEVVVEEVSLTEMMY